MKRIHFIGLAILFALTLLGGYWLGTSRNGVDENASMADGGASIAETGGEGAVLYWRAPMDATETYPGPGKSKMGMDLIPVYANEIPVSTAGSVVISDAVSQQMGVRYGEVHRMDLFRSIRTVGEVKVNEERVFLVNSYVSGWIKKLHVGFDGAPVQKGEPLLEIYSPDLVSTQEEYIRAVRYVQSLSETARENTVEDAKRLVDAAKTRLLNWGVSAGDIEHLGHTLTAEQHVVVRSPVTGVVLQKEVIEGGYINKGSNLYRIADLSTVWVHASFYDYELPWIEEGQLVEVELSYLPGTIYTGVVSYIYPVLREQARDVHVRIVVSNRNRELKPGMFANVQLAGKTLKNVVVVPTEAIIRSGQRSLVFVSDGNGTFEPREVETGGEGGPGNGLAHVLSGVEEGELVVTSAQFLIDSESRLQEALQKMRNGIRDGSRLAPGDVSRMNHDDHDQAGQNASPVQNQAPASDSTGKEVVRHDH